MRRVVLGLLWLGLVQSITIKEPENSMPETKKTKRYLNHGIASSTPPPCPPFYPHFDMPKLPIHSSRPYGPPAYPRPVYGPPPVPQYHHQVQQHSVYIPPQHQSTIEWSAKPQVTVPIYQPQQYQQEKPIIHIKPIIKEQLENNYWQIPQSYEKPQHAYAPMFIPTTQKDWIKPLNYHAAEANRFNNPGIVYKDDHPKDCKPCTTTNQQISYQSIHQRISSPQIIHLQPASYAKPIIHQAPVRPVPHYLPAPVQTHIVKHHEHVEPCDK